ncbi:MAG: CBS domain-containing protein [Tepidiformaceae bacterium]
MYGHVADLLLEKGGQVYTVSKRASVREAVREMNQKGVGSLLVVDDGRPVGIFTERDVLRRVVDVDRDPVFTLVVEVMTPDPRTAAPSMRIDEAIELMTKNRVRHLPVVDEGQLLGLVSIGDVLHWAMIQQQDHIDHMTDYITGTSPVTPPTLP